MLAEVDDVFIVYFYNCINIFYIFSDVAYLYFFCQVLLLGAPGSYAPTTCAMTLNVTIISLYNIALVK